jgi:hypothetical protein
MVRKFGVGAAMSCAGWAFVLACTGDDPNLGTVPAKDDGGASTSSSSGGSSSGASSSGDSDATIDTFVPAACTAGSVRCQGAQVEQCNAEGTGYVVQKLCDTAELCKPENGGSCETPACATNATRCTGAAFEKCNAGRTAFTKERDCASAALCNADGAGDAGAGCTAAACADGFRYCDFGCAIISKSTDDCIAKCKADRTGYELEVNCGYAGGGDRCADNAGNPQCI